MWLWAWLALAVGLARSAVVKDLTPAGAPHPGPNPTDCYALVWGNRDYRDDGDDLESPPNDARAMATRLKASGCTVQLRLDRTRADMASDLLWLDQADENDIVVVYFSGHGFEVDGRNYLVPVDFGPDPNRTLAKLTVPLAEVTGRLPRTGGGVVFLDACRTFDLRAKGFKGGGSAGLVGEGGPGGTLVAYATSAGQVTPDGERTGYSPWTGALVDALFVPGVHVEDALQRVYNEVRPSGLVPDKQGILANKVYLGGMPVGSPGPADPVLLPVKGPRPRPETALRAHATAGAVFAPGSRALELGGDWGWQVGLGGTLLLPTAFATVRLGLEGSVGGYPSGEALVVEGCAAGDLTCVWVDASGDVRGTLLLGLGTDRWAAGVVGAAGGRRVVWATQDPAVQTSWGGTEEGEARQAGWGFLGGGGVGAVFQPVRLVHLQATWGAERVAVGDGGDVGLRAALSAGVWL